jgi:hypothetical protein
MTLRDKEEGWRGEGEERWSGREMRENTDGDDVGRRGSVTESRRKMKMKGFHPLSRVKTSQ